METMLLEIVTPERIAYAGNVDMVSAPTASGIVGILPHHIALFTKLVEGEVKINKDKEEIYYAIGGGFMEVSGKKVTILVTSAMHAKELNEQEILAAQKRAKEAMQEKKEGQEYMEAQALFRRSTIALKLLRRRKGKIITGA